MNNFKQVSKVSVLLLSVGILLGCHEDKEAIGPVTPACLPVHLPILGTNSYGMQPEFNERGAITGYYTVEGETRLDGLMPVERDDAGRIISIQTDISQYYVFRYEDDKIIEQESESDDPEKAEDDRYNVYLLDPQGRITGKENHDIDNGVEEIEYRETYEYDQKGNIVKIYEENLTEGEKDTTFIEYDEHPNPFHTVGFDYNDDGLFSFLSLSVNNPTKISSSEYPAEEIFYEYDAAGNPTKYTYQYHDREYETDDEGNIIGEIKTVVKTIEYKAAYNCK